MLWNDIIVPFFFGGPIVLSVIALIFYFGMVGVFIGGLVFAVIVLSIMVGHFVIETWKDLN